MAVFFGLVEPAGEIKGDGNLRCQNAGPRNILIIDCPRFYAIERGEHSEYFAVRVQQRDGEQLADIQRRNKIRLPVRSIGGSVGGVFGDEYIFFVNRSEERRVGNESR